MTALSHVVSAFRQTVNGPAKMFFNKGVVRTFRSAVEAGLKACTTPK
jgi:hypothetical protein